MSTLTISFEAKGEERFNCASSKMTKFAMVYTVENKIEDIYECLNTASNTITTDGRAILQSLIDTSNTHHNDLYETINTISKDLLDNLGKNPLGTFSRRIFSNEVWEVIIILDDPSINKMTSEECENMIHRFGHLDFPNRDEELESKNKFNPSDLITLKPFIEIEAIKLDASIKVNAFETSYLKLSLDEVTGGLLGETQKIAHSILSNVNRIYVESESFYGSVFDKLNSCPKLRDTKMNDKINILSDMFDQEDLSNSSFDLSTPDFNITLTFKEVNKNG